MQQYDIHPFADKFAIMPDAEIIELAEDIRKHGQQEPVVRYNGQIIDGRNRLVACKYAKVAPLIEEWLPRPGETPVTFIVSRNIRRRHLTSSQRASLALAMEQAIAEEHRALREQNRRERAEARKATGQPAAPPISFSGAEDQPSAETGAKTPVPPARFALGRVRETASKALDVSTGYIQQAANLQAEYPERYKQINDPVDPKSIPRIQEEIVSEALAVAGKSPLEVTVDDLEAADVKLRQSAARQALQRLQDRAARAEPAPSRPRVKIPKFGKVASSRTTVRLVVSFGNPAIAEELLNAWNDDKRVVDIHYDVLVDEKAANRERARYKNAGG